MPVGRSCRLTPQTSSNIRGGALPGGRSCQPQPPHPVTFEAGPCRAAGRAHLTTFTSSNGRGEAVPGGRPCPSRGRAHRGDRGNPLARPACLPHLDRVRWPGARRCWGGGARRPSPGCRRVARAPPGRRRRARRAASTGWRPSTTGRGKGGGGRSVGWGGEGGEGGVRGGWARSREARGYVGGGQGGAGARGRAEVVRSLAPNARAGPGLWRPRGSAGS